MKLSGALIEAFSGTFLSGRYDHACPTPPFHREAWDLYASDEQNCCVIAPRSHAKTTALTYDYILAATCWRAASYVILIGSTEDKAQEMLSNISEELHENKDLAAEFMIDHFEVDQKTDIIVVFSDGSKFRIVARGAEQKIRGAMWGGQRPDLIVCDDMEDDEQVESKARRVKFSRWFFRAAKQALSKDGKIRVHGTILHEDSLLSRLRKNKAWHCLFYRAHKSYSDFSELLWPARWDAESLRKIQKEFEGQGDAEGYSQEYLNDPSDRSDTYLKKEEFLSLDEDHKNGPLKIYMGVDFAVTKKESADRTVLVIGGRTLDGFTCILDVRKGRWDALETVSELFLAVAKWDPDVVFVEGGTIWNALKPNITSEMLGYSRTESLAEIIGDKDLFVNIEALNPVKDKATRGRALQKRMKAGRVLFDKDGSWYGDYEAELLKFTDGKQAAHDDQFDATATLFLGIEKLPAVDEDDFEEEDEVAADEWNYQHALAEGDGGRSAVTGY